MAGMPITHAEWGNRQLDPMEDVPAPEPVGEFDTEADLVLAFLSANHEHAFTRTEIVRGVDFGETASPESVLDALRSIPNQLVDVAGDLVASGMVVDQVSDALDQLVADGTVDRAKIERADGEAEIYYRLAKS
jgi:hypothetical protein